MRILQLPHVRAVVTDVLALVLFVVIGLLNHHGGISGVDFVRDGVSIVGCWLLAAGTFDLYRRPTLRALLETWLVGITAGVVVRTLLLWHVEADDAVFLGVALPFTLLFVVAARTAASFVPAYTPRA
jgi:hypothetical protein